MIICRMVLLLNNLVFCFVCRGRRSYVTLRNHKDQLYYAYIHMIPEQNVDYQNVILEYLYTNTTLSLVRISISMIQYKAIILYLIQYNAFPQK